MNKGLKKILSAVLAMIMVLSSVTVMNISVAYAADSTYIMDAAGVKESAYVEWTTVPNATGFAAYIKGAGEADSAYARLDNELIRKYPTYFRADAVGLKAGQYVMKVVPVINNSLDESKAFTTGTLDVKAYDRSGFTFSSQSKFSSGVGAYNNDGTLKSGAKVLYVTKDTAKTVSTDVATSNKGSEKITGFQAIIDAYQKGLDKTPIAFRIIGTIEDGDMDGFSSSAEGLQVKGKNSYSELNITIEGIGEDAAINGFGILCRNAGNVELRNFGILSCKDDSISLDTDNTDIWIHNMDLFYGKAGGASDQAKGDGTIDVKADSQYVTISYNHFWDSGKSSLCGMTSESGPNYITYHHNWFDHSDSRHPRIRTMSVHVYNNYYDGNAKYGVGAAKDSCAFVESNYFDGCKHPMLSSLQGSDIMENAKTGVPDFSAKGTFSGENGGIIKAYNNIVIGSDADKFNGGVEPVYYDANDTKTNGKSTQFDAYLVSSRSEKVPSSVKALSGGKTYDNFDTSVDLGVSESDITPVADVPAVVKAEAGRINGGDFPTDRSQFVGLTDATSSDVDTALKAAITSYKSSLVSVGGTELGGVVDTTESTTEAQTEATTEAKTEVTTEAKTETTTSSTPSTPVEIGEAQTGFTSDNTSDTGAGISVIYNAANNTWALTDTSSTAAAELTIPFAEQTSGKVIISGTAQPSTTASKWMFVQVRGTKADNTASEIIAFGGGATKADLSVRVNGAATYNKVSALSAKSYDYTIIIDLDNKTAEVTIDGVTNTYTGLDVASISSLYSTTSKSGSRNVSVSVPYVGVLGDEVVTTEATTELTTVATTEATTAPTTEATTAPTTEATTEETTQEPDPTPTLYGDVNYDGQRNIVDCNILISQVNNGYVAPVAGVNDVTMDGKVDSADVATILQKILNGAYIMPCEIDKPVIDPTTEATTETTTEETTVATTEETTTEETTVATTEETTTEATTVETTEETTESVEPIGPIEQPGLPIDVTLATGEVKFPLDQAYTGEVTVDMTFIIDAIGGNGSVFRLRSSDGFDHEAAIRLVDKSGACDLGKAASGISAGSLVVGENHLSLTLNTITGAIKSVLNGVESSRENDAAYIGKDVKEIKIGSKADRNLTLSSVSVSRS